MDAKETIKYLYENGHIIGREHYKTIYDELTALSIQSKSRFNDWLLAKAENKKLLVIIKNALTSLAIVSMPTMGNDVATDEEILKIMGDSFREALKGQQ